MAVSFGVSHLRSNPTQCHRRDAQVARDVMVRDGVFETCVVSSKLKQSFGGR
jgi:hypothetical protein